MIKIHKRILIISIAILLLSVSFQSISYALGRSKIYWTQRFKISRANLDGKNVEDVITDRFIPEDIAIDTRNGKIFWTETGEVMFKGVKLGTGTIHRAESDGSNIIEIRTGYKTPLEGGNSGQTCIQGVCKAYIKPEGKAKVDLEPEQVSNPSSIAVDTEMSKIYWVDEFHDRFQRADIDGSKVEIIRKERGVGINDIELDLKRNMLYWLSARSIKRMDLNGNEIEVVIDRWNVSILSFDLDVKAQHIYWTSSIKGIIHRSNFRGEDIQEIVTDLKEPDNIVVDAQSQKIYWTSWDRKTNLHKIQRSNLDGTEVTDLITDLPWINGLALDIEGIYDVSPKSKLTTTWGNIKVE